MHSVVDDHAKMRLIDTMDIARAILTMSHKGIPPERLLSELMKIFYVDLDLYYDVAHGQADESDLLPADRIAA